MSSEKDIFSICGPTYLTSVDWACQHHCRSVAASLVQAVYVLERDRQLNRQFPGAFAPHWWEFFHFDLIRKLVDDADNSIFGAIFELNPNSQTGSISNAPRFVVAFRGTITEQDSISRDVTLNLHVIQNSLHTTSRFLIAMQAVKNVASAFPNSVIWLAGHSLGSALAMLVARNMVKTGKLLDTFLFNPPFCGAPIEGIRDERVKQGIRIARSLITAGLNIALRPREERPILEYSFSMMAAWAPHLFINPNDHLCSEYIGYFEHRKNMEEFGVGSIERLATQNSIGDIFLKALGRESEPLHLLPSANLTTNVGPARDFKWAHGIQQWWQPDLNLVCKQYRYT
ncbi:alpha/beta-Hydrolases superfamily protein [Rhynchospora pubera]|uniref:Alpha/beta-Hydrolases superfamily protein n=1 Tax=Rhynchospora pubera TaxID=906938 RepID=A0AAV8DLB1_9POAL|nr:alpha/beta-Hydrolases superfamily protein [Rhynchospora pubera]